MLVPSGLIFIWHGTEASIPAGWQRVTSLNDKFIKGTANATDPDDTGGSATHSHSGVDHTHSIETHSHSGDTTRDGAGETDGGGSQTPARDNHLHSYSVSNITGGDLTGGASYASKNHEPPHTEIIFIEPASDWVGLSDEILGFINKTTVPEYWDFCDGTDSTPDLRNKYLKGASAGADAGGTGGSTSHNHTIDHSHGSVLHGHTGTSGYDSDQQDRDYDADGTGGGPATPHHTHVITLDSTSETTGSYTGTSPDKTVEVAYKKLMAIKNNSGGQNLPKGLIGMWLGTLANIPQGWNLCDGSGSTPDMRGYYLKSANDNTELENTGGQNTHSHSASNSHTHSITSGSHDHTGSSDYQDSQGTTTANPNGCAKAHDHDVDTCSSSTSSLSSTQTSSQSSSNEPEYRTVAFLQAEYSLVNSSPMLGLM